MQNNLIKVEDEFQEENEVSIYDFINIFIKNIKLFMIVSILGIVTTCLYVAKRIVFDKNNTIYINYTLNYEEMNSYIGNNVYYPKKNPKEILLDNKYIELLFENPELKDETEKELISPDSYRTTVRINRRSDSGRKISDSVMTAYLNILNQYYKENMFDYLAERKKYLEKTLPMLKKQLEVNAVSGNIPITSGGTGATDNNYFKYIYPIQVSNIDTYYEKYKTLETEYQAIKTLFDLELNKTENFIKYDSSIIVEKEKSGNIIKLGIGVFLSLCLGILATFIKEFIEGYKKNKETL